MDKKTAILYAQLKPYKALVNKTSGFIKWALQSVTNPYVACSFGKDSSVMLDMILYHKPRIQVIWITFPETRILNNYQEMVDWWILKKNINLREIHIDIPANEDFDDKEAFPKFPFDSYFVGITKEESFGRRVSLRKHGMLYKKNDGITRISPLADWKVDDISAYHRVNNIPFLNSYKQEGFQSRTVTGFTEDIQGFRVNQINELKKRDINKYNELMSKWPKLSQYG